MGWKSTRDTSKANLPEIILSFLEHGAQNYNQVLNINLHQQLMKIYKYRYVFKSYRDIDRDNPDNKKRMRVIKNETTKK